MGTLIGLSILFLLFLRTWRNQQQKQQVNGGTSNSQKSVELDRIQRRLREKQEQERIQYQQEELIRQTELFNQKTKEKTDVATSAKQAHERAQQVKLLIKQAKLAIAQDTETYNPFDIKLLLAAIEYYHQSYLLISQDSFLQLIDSLQIEIDRRHEFQCLFRTATKYFHDKYFEKALTTLLSAQELYSPPQLIKTIVECRDLAKAETAYLKYLADAKKLSHSGKFSEALDIVVLAGATFPRQDGADLQVSLNRVIAATEQLNLGNVQQKSGDINAAQYHYAAALHLVPEWKEPQLKLAMIEAQAGDTSAAIDRLANINSPATKCWEGLLHTRRGEYQTAKEIWSKLDSVSAALAGRDLVREYWQLVSNETSEQCRLIQPQIKQFVDRGELEQARAISLEFISQYGSDSLIETNLKNCILPGIETKIWTTEDWPKIAALAHENWLSQPNIRSLHNWAVALFYASQIDHNLEKLIIAWATAIANISLDPILQDIPWLAGKLPSLDELSDRLWQILDLRIEATKDSDLPKYLALRDCYRREFWAMQLAKEQPDTKMMLGELIILPACFQRYYPQFSLGEELKVWKTLYTNWGKAVAACLAGDPQRAEIIKADLDINSSLEEFASQFILYQQGCYYLQQEDWRGAIYQFNDARITIRNNYQWHDEVDRLCTNHRLKIIDFEEHLDFSRFWHDLLPTPQSETYFVEYQALKIQLDWSNSLIPDAESLAKIQDLLYYYPLHPTAQETFTQINDYWLQNG
jgi:tetratricopeptide (TPR) repeat protein